MPKDQLRFGGKSFEEWQSIARTDLKPERRVEALRALGTFGINGRAEEAARTIVEITAFYDPLSRYAGDNVVVKCANEEMIRLPCRGARKIGART